MDRPITCLSRLLSLTTTPVAALLLWAPAALAGGPLQPPDGVGNPDGGDYTGYAVVALFQDIQEDGTTLTRFQCINMGGANADDVVVQFFEDFGPPDRDPKGIRRLGPIYVGESEVAHSSSFVVGNVSTHDTARILAIDSVRRKSPALICQAHYVSVSTGRPHGSLPEIKIAKKKRRRRR